MTSIEELTKDAEERAQRRATESPEDGLEWAFFICLSGSILLALLGAPG